VQPPPLPPTSAPQPIVANPPGTPNPTPHPSTGPGTGSLM